MALKAQVIFDIAGNALQQLRRLSSEATRLGREQVGALSRLGSAADSALGKIDRLGNRYTAFLTGAAGIGAVNSVIDLDARFTRIGTTVGATAEQVKQLKQEIFDVARAPDIRVDPAEITSAVETILERVGDLDLARQNLRNIALTIKAAQADGADVGALIANNFEKFGIKDAQEILRARPPIRARRKGSFTLKNLATQGNRVTGAFSVFGQKGIPAVRDLGAVLEVIAKDAGSPEEAATNFEALLAVFSDAEKVKFLQRSHIQVFDPKNPGRIRELSKLIPEIITKTGGDVLELSKVFDRNALDALKPFITLFKSPEGFALLNSFVDVQADGASLVNKSATNAATAQAAITSIKATLGESLDRNLSEPIQHLADAINALDPDKLDRIVDGALALAGIGAGGVLALKLGRPLVKRAIGLGRFLRGKGGG